MSGKTSTQALREALQELRTAAWAVWRTASVGTEAWVVLGKAIPKADAALAEAPASKEAFRANLHRRAVEAFGLDVGAAPVAAQEPSEKAFDAAVAQFNRALRNWHWNEAMRQALSAAYAVDGVRAVDGVAPQPAPGPLPEPERRLVERFAVAMRAQLLANERRGKSGWEWMSCKQLLRRAEQELGELRRAVESGAHPVDVVHEAAHVSSASCG